MRTLFGIWLMAAASALAADPPQLDPAFRLVREAVARDEVPGAIALVARKGTILRHEAMGWSDPVERVPFATNTLCWIASITKPVTVAAAMALVDQGKLSLDDPIEKFLPEFKDQKDSEGKHRIVTVRHIMTHTSGLPVNPPTRRSGWPIGGALDESWLQKGWDEIMRDTARTPLRFVPGSKVEYSNGAFFVLGRTIEQVSGRPFAEQVKGTMLQPLGMSDTFFAPPSAAAKRVSPIFAERWKEDCHLPL